ncbi:MAG TPA: hypothetical protein VGV09_16905 [Steroidobacteraceae bacterium]|nr:hypothetical protein [Steroidobacteraceae bacterium]
MSQDRAGYAICSILCAVFLDCASAAAAPANPDPCKLLTAAEVSAAAGVTVSAGVSAGDGRTCSWSGNHVVVSLWFPDPRIWAATEHPNAMVVQTPAAGIGDAAFYNSMGNLTSMGVKRGSQGFVVKIYGASDPSKQKAVERTLAEHVLAKM